MAWPAAGTDRGGPERDGGLREYRPLEEASEPATPDYPHGEKGQSQRERRVQGGRL